MKRLWIAVAMLAIIIALTVCSTYFIKSYSSSIDEKLIATQKLALSGDALGAAAICREIENEWTNYENVLRLFVNSDDVGQIGITLALLEPFAENNKTAELLAQISAARVQLIHLADSESVY